MGEKTVNAIADLREAEALKTVKERLETGEDPIKILESAARVEEYMKKLLENLKPGGGFLVTSAVSGIPDEAKPENVKAMVEAVMKYGRY